MNYLHRPIQRSNRFIRFPAFSLIICIEVAEDVTYTYNIESVSGDAILRQQLTNSPALCPERSL